MDDKDHTSAVEALPVGSSVDRAPRGPEIEPAELAEQAIRISVGAATLTATWLVGALRRGLGVPEAPRGELRPTAPALLAGAALGLAIEASRQAARVITLLGRTASWLLEAPGMDGVEARGRRVLEELDATWVQTRPEAEEAASAFVQALVPAVTKGILDRLDLTTMALDNLDMGAITEAIPLDDVVARVDVDAIVERVDLDAIIARIDIDALAQQVIEDLDMPQLVRDSTTSVTAAVVDEIRYGSVDADQTVSRTVDRILRRDRRQRP